MCCPCTCPSPLTSSANFSSCFRIQLHDHPRWEASLTLVCPRPHTQHQGAWGAPRPASLHLLGQAGWTASRSGGAGVNLSRLRRPPFTGKSGIPVPGNPGSGRLGAGKDSCQGTGADAFSGFNQTGADERSGSAQTHLNGLRGSWPCGCDHLLLVRSVAQGLFFGR